MTEDSGVCGGGGGGCVLESLSKRGTIPKSIRLCGGGGGCVLSVCPPYQNGRTNDAFSNANLGEAIFVQLFQGFGVSPHFIFFSDYCVILFSEI